MVKVFGIDGKEKGEITLPKVFSTDLRTDLIKKVVLAIQANKRQAYGVDPLAGLRTSAHYHGVRHKRHGMMNREMARQPRTHGSNPGQEMRARRTPQAVSGRKAHPPVAEKVWSIKINKKEKKLALASAIAATASLELVKVRHKVNSVQVPLIFDDQIEGIQKSSNLKAILDKVGMKEDLERVKERKVRPGKGKMRGRRYRRGKSALIVVGNDKGILKAVGNLPGIEVCNAKDLNVELLAPGTVPGRLTLWSESAVKKIGEMYG